MRIIEIEYSELKNIGDYEHRKIGARAIIHENENPDEEIKKLRDWVVTQQERLRVDMTYEIL